MPENEKFYTVYKYGDKVAHGREIHINHSVRLNDEGTAIADIAKCSLKDLLVMRGASVSAENAEFEKLCSATESWEKIAAETQRFDRAIEYVKTPVTQHTSNQWQKTENDSYEISNMTYKMWYRIYERTRYDRELKKSVPIAWDLSWSLYTNAPQHKNQYPVSNMKIDGQDRKLFPDKAKMEKYIDGRKRAYSHLFIQLSPPVPKEYSIPFFVNGLLLPGYELEGERAAPEQTPGNRKSHNRSVKDMEHGDR